ncbi:MAG: hypothetical protein RBR09_00325 [Desulfobulbaceae bacterium]|nr:hypothetical protein [Desulfobulbaceae bacterium]MDY0349675.1 hypothetical protein [Desulfobulbaceae bacterium]
MNDAVDLRGIADMADFHININEIFEAFHLNGQGWPVGEMIDEGRNFAEIDGFAKKLFHKQRKRVLAPWQFSRYGAENITWRGAWHPVVLHSFLSRQ